MSGNYDFSVIIPTHQRPEMLLRCLNALNQQNFAFNRFEVIVIPSPNDPAIKELRTFKPSYQLRVELPLDDVYQGKNVSFKRNYGAQVAKAPWLAYTDDDCHPKENWLLSASKHIHKDGIGGIEGKTITPENSPKTLVWKGMQRLATPGGYQTCNIFFNKEIFLQTGGFDFINFPWYLEDTDLAWSILETGNEIIHEPEALIEHPVNKPAPWRLTHEARNTGLKVKLFQKHPDLYKKNGMKALRRSHYIYLALITWTLTGLIFLNWPVIASGLVGILTILTLHMFRLFSDVSFSWGEVFEVAFRTLTFPLYASFSIIKESLNK